MSAFDPSVWQQADVNADNDRSEAPEPGTYDVALTDARAFTSKSGNAIVILEFRVMGGPAHGHEWSELRGFKNEGQVKAAKATCAKLGVNVDEVSSLEQIDAGLKQHVGDYYTVDIVQNGQYRNCYVQGKANGAPPSDVPNDLVTAPAAPPADDDDIPF